MGLKISKRIFGVGGVVSNKDSFAAGFAWLRPERILGDDIWLRDLAPALVIAVASSLLVMISDAYSQLRPFQQTSSTGGPPHDSNVIQVATSVN
jgi:hypothetical protein